MSNISPTPTLENWLRETSKRYGVTYELQLGGFLPDGMRFFLTPAGDKSQTVVINLRGNTVEVDTPDAV